MGFCPVCLGQLSGNVISWICFVLFLLCLFFGDGVIWVHRLSGCISDPSESLLKALRVSFLLFWVVAVFCSINPAEAAAAVENVSIASSGLGAVPRLSHIDMSRIFIY